MLKNQTLTLLAAASMALGPLANLTLRASDHADGPTVAGDQAADLADCYMFRDPGDPTKLVIINTLRGFIVPGEAVNFAIFDSAIRYRFQIENTEDAKPDAFIDVRFSPKNSSSEQTASVKFSGSAFAGFKGGAYTGKTTVASLAGTVPAGYFPAVAQKLKDNQGTDSTVEFFAGETDDPFFFDIPAFARFRAIVVPAVDKEAAKATAAAQFNRGRDTFAGYNVMTIAFRIPITALKNKKPSVTNATKFGLNVLAQRGTERTVKGRKIATGSFATVDREGLPAVNALLVPIELKNAFNGGTTIDDARGKFAGALTGSLQALGTSQTNIDLLASLVVTRGDILRIDTGLASAFPNGRTPADDVVKTLLTIISNANEAGPPTTFDDNVPANEVAFETNFPYLGLPHQPLARVPNDPTLPDTNVDDTTRN
jgi:hypothetical protein